MNTILIIDDEAKLRTLMARIIGLEGFTVIEAGTAKAGLKKLETTEVSIVICDVKLPDGNGVDLIKQVKQKAPLAEIILLTAYGNIPDGIQAMKNGAFDYIVKGDDNNKIIPLVYRAIEKVNLQAKFKKLEAQVQKNYSFDTIIGKSKPIQEAVNFAKKVSETDATVLLLGETGSGKEVFAQAIHYGSLRRDHSFMAINCSAFGKDILESEIFGHKAGAFTGAVKDKKGLIEEADKGTLFLDEIGEMQLELQSKLLRVLETGEFIKVGDTKPTRVSVRIIAATNRNLQKEAEQGNFREDLFYRLNVFTINIPSLNERREDIALLAEHFIAVFNLKSNKRITSMDKGFVQLLQQHNWRGNIRELKNVIERAMILSAGNELQQDDLPADIRNEKPVSSNGNLSAFDLASMEKLHIQRVLNHTNNNKTETARLLNIGLTTLYRKIEEYHL